MVALNDKFAMLEINELQNNMQWILLLPSRLQSHLVNISTDILPPTEPPGEWSYQNIATYKPIWWMILPVPCQLQSHLVNVSVNTLPQTEPSGESFCQYIAT